MMGMFHSFWMVRYNLNMKCIIFLVLGFLFISRDVSSEILVYDDIGVNGSPLMLRVKTYEGFFKKGGVPLRFFVNNRFYGKGLSGGDGYGYKEFLPTMPSLYKIKVVSPSGDDTGNVLILDKGSSIFIIDIDEIKENSFSNRLRKNTKKGILRLKKRYHVIFIYKGDIKKGIKKWLQDNSFKDIPILIFNGEELFEEIMGKGLKIVGILGTPDIIDLARRYKIKFFTFSETDELEPLNDWDDLLRRVR